MFEINKIIRENIRNLIPYSSARDEYTGKEAVFLDANENPFNNPYNRYPDPLQWELKGQIGKLKNTDVKNIFLGNGSDEAIDLLIRAFCEPGKDNIVSIAPSYGMYEVAANINNIPFKKVLLTAGYQVDNNALQLAIDDNTRLIFFCSPNNPTGNTLNNSDILGIAENFKGLVVVDEAYIDFANGKGLLPQLNKLENLVILQTFSKAWGMAGIRLGMAFANEQVISVLNKIKYPYNVNALTINHALKYIENYDDVRKWIDIILQQREIVSAELQELGYVKKIYPSDANFILVKVENPGKVYQYLVESKIIVRDRSKVVLCEGCLRITIGLPEENKALVNAMMELARGLGKK